MRKFVLLTLGLLFSSGPAFALCNQPGAGNIQLYDGNGAACVNGGAGPLTPNASLVFPATIGNASTALFTGGTAQHNLIVFNNSAPDSVWLWCNQAGGTAAPGAGIVIPPGGGAYSWDFGITTVPNCISGTQTGGASASSVNVSGAGG